MKEMNVYLADDDIDDIDFFREALADVNKAANLATGKNGMDLMKKLLYPELPFPDLIFLDINMPLMNGLECLKEIKAHEHLKDIPVVMYSTSTLSATIQLAYRLGASLFIEKNTDFNQFKKVLKPLIEKDWSQHSRPADIAAFVLKAS